VPKLKELRARYGDQGLVLIGIHTTNGGAEMKAYVEASGIDYPVAIDRGNATKKAFAVDSYPDYYLIDRAGKLRFADLSNGELERAIKTLIAEPAPKPAPVPAALTRAKKKDKRLLVVWGSEASRAPVDALLKRKLRTLAYNEFEVVRLTRADEPELAMRWNAGERGLAASVIAADGSMLGRIGTDAANAETLEKFLSKHRVPQKDATALWEEAKAQAVREQKNILVHLGAPW
jgi:hypothetical protein